MIVIALSWWSEVCSTMAERMQYLSVLEDVEWALEQVVVSQRSGGTKRKSGDTGFREARDGKRCVHIFPVASIPLTGKKTLPSQRG